MLSLDLKCPDQEQERMEENDRALKRILAERIAGNALLSRLSDFKECKSAFAMRSGDYSAVRRTSILKGFKLLPLWRISVVVRRMMSHVWRMTRARPESRKRFTAKRGVAVGRHFLFF